jgi:hypothetical protein
MTTAHHELAGLNSAASKWSVRHGEAAAASRHERGPEHGNLLVQEALPTSVSAGDYAAPALESS